MILPRVPDNWAAIAFTSNLNEKSSEATRRLKESLREFPATTWNDVYNKYSTKLKIEEDTVPRLQKEERNLKARFGGYNFNVSTSELVAVLRSMGDKVRWPKKMRSNPNRLNPDHWCEFHNDHGHKTADCMFLQSEVDHLLKQGYLTELFCEKGKQAYMKNRQEPPKPPSPKRTVNFISGGEDVKGISYAAANKISKVTITQGKRVRYVLEEDNIIFNDANADGVLTPHNDALVISLIIHDTNMKRVLIDPGSSVNIILLRVLREMQAEDKMIQKAHTLSGSDNSSILTKGEVTLTTSAEGVIKDTKFQVVDMEMAYNMILGRPWIYEMDVVPSTLYQVIKFPSPWGICQIRGDQHTTRAINSVADTSMRNEDKFSGFLVSNRGIEVNPAQIKAIEEIPDIISNKKEVQRLTGRIAALGRFISKSSEKCFKFFSAIKKQDHFEWNEECQQALRNLKMYLSNPPLLAKPKAGERLLIYLAILEVAVSTVLVREEQGKQSPIYYVSNSLLDAETQYPQLEKLALALILASRKLRPYFQCHPIAVVTAYPLRNILHKHELSGLGMFLVPSTGETIRQAIKCHSITNNEVEYEAMIAGPELARELGMNQIIIKSDSQLVVNQMLGTYANREARMQQYLEKVRELIKQFQTWKVIQIPRDENAEVDALANLASAADVYGTIPDEKKKAHAVRKKAAWYCLKQGRGAYELETMDGKILPSHWNVVHLKRYYF
ncbi:uncharacterized protein [Nicotiana sylvestris]|uniref:uncharacterized protein n=1 Tax=Nicotiana sylvestris TaxID=4096 RepID=UPI00388CD863